MLVIETDDGWRHDPQVKLFDDDDDFSPAATEPSTAHDSFHNFPASKGLTVFRGFQVFKQYFGALFITNQLIR